MNAKHDGAAKEAYFCLYPLWRCSCGALGSGAWAPDIDEVADQLLEVLGIDAHVSQPVVPIPGSSVISAQRYDANMAINSLRQIVSRHGYRLQTNSCREHDTSIRCLRVRAANVFPVTFPQNPPSKV